MSTSVVKSHVRSHRLWNWDCIRLGSHDLANLVGKEDPFDLHFSSIEVLFIPQKLGRRAIRAFPQGMQSLLLYVCIYLSIYVCLCLLPLYLKNGTIFHQDIAHGISLVQYLNAYRFWENSDSRWLSNGRHLEKPLNSSNFLNNGPIHSVFFDMVQNFKGNKMAISDLQNLARFRGKTKSREIVITRSIEK